MSGVGYTFPDDERLVPRFSEITDGPQQRIYYRAVWDAIPLPLFAGSAGSGLGNDNGVLLLLDPTAYPTDSAGLPPGALYAIGFGETAVIGVTSVTPTVGAPLVFGIVTAFQLLVAGGTTLPLSSGAAGSGILWNNGGLVCVS